MKLIILLFLFAGWMGYTHANMDTSVPHNLIECYTNATLLDRNNLPPTTMAVLIDIIRILEDKLYPNIDLGQLVTILIHKYRKDGIQCKPKKNDEVSYEEGSGFLPCSATFYPFYRYALLMTKILPSPRVSQTLREDILPSTLKCTLHHMVSLTADARDEDNCNKLANHRAPRRRRSYYSRDVELLENLSGTDNMARVSQDLNGDSRCPLAGGVVWSRWGEVAAGDLLAGIAAGTRLQGIPVKNLLPQGSTYNETKKEISSIYPATLTGDLSEYILKDNSVGGTGRWNNSNVARFYKLTERNNLAMVDFEIRGDIDGLLNGRNLSSENMNGKYNSLKLSQLLDMYYSDRNGVFSKEARACNRKNLFQDISNTNFKNNLKAETASFAAVLSSSMPLQGTYTKGFQSFADDAVEKLYDYLPRMNDVNCDVTEMISHDYRLKMNLYIVVDGSWQYETVYPAISHLLDVIEVGKYGSSITLLDAFDGRVFVGKTFSLAHFHTEYTRSKHSTLRSGVDLRTSLTNIRIMMHEELNMEKNINYVGGNSSVLLFLLNAGNLQSDDSVLTEARILNETVPDLRIVFATSGDNSQLLDLVRDRYNDVIKISLTNEDSDLEKTLSDVVKRLQVGRRIINPKCGSEYPRETTSGIRQFEDNVEPGYINFYSISPNYFYEEKENRKIRIRNSGGNGMLVVCHSTSDMQPRQNSASDDSRECRELSSGNLFEISLENPCAGYYTINSCPFFFISVQSIKADLTSASCTDGSCRFPYNVQYQIQIQDFGCYNSTSHARAGFVTVLVLYLGFCVLNML